VDIQACVKTVCKNSADGAVWKCRKWGGSILKKRWGRMKKKRTISGFLIMKGRWSSLVKRRRKMIIKVIFRRRGVAIVRLRGRQKVLGLRFRVSRRRRRGRWKIILNKIYSLTKCMNSDHLFLCLIEFSANSLYYYIQFYVVNISLVDINLIK
jgi:hypothetical protein